MNKLKYIIVLTLVLGGYVPSAQAQIKFDGGNSLNKISSNISKWQEQTQKLFEQAATMQTMVSYGKGAMEAAKKIQEGVAAAQEMAGSIKDSLNSVKDGISSTIADAQGEFNGLKGDVTGAVGSATGELSNAASKTQNAQKLIQLETEIANIEAEYESGAKVRKNELEGKIKAYKENNETYQKMISEDPSQRETLEAQIAANNEAIKSLQEEFDKKEAEEKASSDSRVSEIKAQVSELKDVVAQESLSLAKEGLSSVKSLFGGGSEAELNKTIANNFISENEEETSATIKKVRRYRQKVAAEDTLAVYAFALKTKAEREADNENIDKLADDVPSMDGSSGAIAMGTQLKVENMKALVLYTKVLIADLKMRSAQDLATLTTYKLRDPSKDVTQFNLDDYKYKKTSKLSTDSLKDLAGKASSLGELKDKVNDKVSSLKEAADTIKTGISAVSEVSGIVSSYTNNSSQANQNVSATVSLTTDSSSESSTPLTEKEALPMSNNLIAISQQQAGQVVSANSINLSGQAVMQSAPMTSTGKVINRQAFGTAKQAAPLTKATQGLQAISASAPVISNSAVANNISSLESMAQRPQSTLQAVEGVNVSTEKAVAARADLESLKVDKLQSKADVMLVKETAKVEAQALKAEAKEAAKAEIQSSKAGLSSLKDNITQSQASVSQVKESLSAETLKSKETVSAVKELAKLDVKSAVKAEAQAVKTNVQAIQSNAKAINIDSNSRSSLSVLK